MSTSHRHLDKDFFSYGRLPLPRFEDSPTPSRLRSAPFPFSGIQKPAARLLHCIWDPWACLTFLGSGLFLFRFWSLSPGSPGSPTPPAAGRGVALAVSATPPTFDCFAAPRLPNAMQQPPAGRGWAAPSCQNLRSSASSKGRGCLQSLWA